MGSLVVASPDGVVAGVSVCDDCAAGNVASSDDRGCAAAFSSLVSGRICVSEV